MRGRLLCPWLLGLMLQPHDGPNLPLPCVGVRLSAPHYPSCYDMGGVRAESGSERSGGLLSPLPSVPIIPPIVLPVSPPVSVVSAPGRLRLLPPGLPSFFSLLHFLKCNVLGGPRQQFRHGFRGLLGDRAAK
ncbi:uncharacterized protein G2W53_004665 [Senna tora]|uniref:Secreted protein n=1 Tax=Senna tora TaxID=362788 RepID=A0A834XCM7_9FABA|nr:uncharacterized protein G2W53_004665 [Senna tora]